jgi:hypothetical protein
MGTLISRCRPVLVPLALALLAACGGGSSAAPAVAAADFSLQASPGSLQLPAGGSGFVTLTLSRLNGFTGGVTVTAVGLPPGVAAGGTVPAGSATLQLAIAAAPEVPPAAYSGLVFRAQAGTLTHDTPFSLTVTGPLPQSHLRADLVQAPGGRQTGGSIVNQPLAGEPLPALTLLDATGATHLRHGFLPDGVPTDF